MANLIKQIVQGDGYTQSIKMLVRDNERGPKGEKGDQGDAATIKAGNAYSVPTDASPVVMNMGSATNAIFDFYIPKGEKGDQGIPGYKQYKAGRGIRIINDTIYATGVGPGGGGAWGEIIGDIEDQTDLQEEFAKYTPTNDLATVALSGSYDDLSDKPVIPTPDPQIQSDWDQTNPEAVDYIKNKPTIPEMPTVNDATLTITQNGLTRGTFTANSATNVTANITSPVITMTNTDPLEGQTLLSNNFLAVYGSDPVTLDYSTSEINTGTTWIDGGTIYKKTVSFGTLPNNTTKSVTHGIANLNRVIKLEGYAHRSSDSVDFPVPFTSTSGSSADIAVTTNATDIAITTGTDRSNMTECYITLYYTKSS